MPTEKKPLLRLGHVNTEQGAEIAILQLEGQVATHAVVLAEASGDDGYVAGQSKHLHGLSKGTGPGTWAD